MPKQNSTANRAGTGGRNVIAFLAPVDIRAAAAPDKKAAPTFSMVAYNGGPLTLKGWDYPVVIDQDGWEDLGRNRPALRDHDAGKIVGHTTSTAVTDGKLLVLHCS